MHKGSAFIEVIQPCPSYNDVHTKEYWAGKGNIDPKTGKEVPRYYKLEETGYECIITNDTTEEEYLAKISKFIQKALESGNRVPIGVFYSDLRSKPTKKDLLQECQATSIILQLSKK